MFVGFFNMVLSDVILCLKLKLVFSKFLILKYIFFSIIL